MSNFATYLPLSKYWGGGYRMMLTSMGFLVDHMVGICHIAHDFLESGIPAYVGWVLFAGIIDEGEGGDSEHRVRVERDIGVNTSSL